MNIFQQKPNKWLHNWSILFFAAFPSGWKWSYVTLYFCRICVKSTWQQDVSTAGSAAAWSKISTSLPFFASFLFYKVKDSSGNHFLHQVGRYAVREPRKTVSLSPPHWRWAQLIWKLCTKKPSPPKCQHRLSNFPWPPDHTATAGWERVTSLPCGSGAVYNTEQQCVSSGCY